MKIEGSIALVTGANRGIGKAFTEELLERGAAKVYAGVRDIASVTDSRLVPVALDVTDEARVQAVANELTDVELVINNAGVGRPALPLAVSLADARTELETNYLSIVSMTEAFAPVLAANGGGSFVNMLSVLSWISLPSFATYSASKSAAWAYSNAARLELKRSGTELVAVHAGFVDTDLAGAVKSEKIPSSDVAMAALDGLEAGEIEVLVDDISRGVKSALTDDLTQIYPGIEAEFNATVAS